MGFTHDVCHGRKFQKDGQDKTAWTKVGAIFTNDKGQISLKLDFMPTTVDPRGLWLSIFPVKAKDGQPPVQDAQHEEQPGVDGGIPF